MFSSFQDGERVIHTGSYGQLSSRSDGLNVFETLAAVKRAGLGALLKRHSRPRRYWSRTDEALVVKLYPTETAVATIAAELSRSVGAVRAKAYKFGLRRPKKYSILLDFSESIAPPPRAAGISLRS